MPVFRHHEKAKAFDVVLTGDHHDGAVSVRDIGDDERCNRDGIGSPY